MAKRKPHIVEYVKSGGHSDQYKCSCGWLSEGYWDLPEAAWDEWLLHAYDMGQEIRPKDMARQASVVKDRCDMIARLETQKSRINKQLDKLAPKKAKKS